MSENIKVVCRVRPFNTYESNIKSKSALVFPSGTDNVVSIQGRAYTFDHVLQHNVTQSHVYEVVAKPIVVDVLNGYNGTIFAYGQTASGKTFTMEGSLDDPDFYGIIPRIIHDIFDHIYTMDENIEFHIKVSYFEIYLEKIRDLLDVSKTNLSIHEDKDRVPYVKGATERFVSCPEEVVNAIDEGKANRHVAVTNMNEHSSRSHSVFMIQVTQENIETQKKLLGKLYLVDLAGSEKVGKSGAEGLVLDEAKNINKSLSALGNVINALVEDSSHVPYRDSKLTRILQESLGGNARTTMVICCSPADVNEAETKSTLMFGSRAKTIKNCVTINEELTADEWRRRYEKEKRRNKELKVIITKLELELKKWRAGDRVNQSDWITKSQYGQIAQEAKDMASNTELSSISASTDSLYRFHLEVPQLKLRPATSGGSSSTNELYRIMDDKDDEINKQAQIMERMKEQMEEQDDTIRNLKQVQKQTEIDISRLQSENELSKQEVNDVIQALEELIVNYDQQRQEITNRTGEIEKMQQQLDQYGQLIRTKDSEIQQQKDSNTTHRKKHTEMLSSLIKDLTDIGECISDELSSSVVNMDMIDDDYTVTRLYVTKMKTEAKILQSYMKHLDEDKHGRQVAYKKIDDELRGLKLRVQEYETRIGTLTNNVDESELKKRQFEEKIDGLNAEISRFKANEQLIVNSMSKSKEELDIKSKLDEEFKRQSEQYSFQIKELRDCVDEKQRVVEELREQIISLTLQNEKLKEEYESVVAEVKTKTDYLEAMEKATGKKELARQDLKNLEGTVMKELETLQNMRRALLKDLNDRMIKSTKATNADSGITSEDDDYDASDRTSNRQKIQFLEVHLEQLTNAYKHLVRENSDLRLQLPIFEKRVKINTERVKTLETALKYAKEESMKDRIRYQNEVDRIKEAVRQRNIGYRGTASKIAKPIRAGHAPPHALSYRRPTLGATSNA